MAFERSGFEHRGRDEERVRENAPDLDIPDGTRPDTSPLIERASAPDAHARTPDALTAPALRERMEPAAEEALASYLTEARAAYARAWLNEDALSPEEKDRVTRDYLGAVSAMRTHRKTHFESDPSWSAGERARNMEQLILSFTAEEKTRLIAARDQAKIEERDAAAAASHGRYIVEDYREAAAIFSRGTRHVAEWYRSIPPHYRIAIGAGLFAATAGGVYLGLPLLVAAGGSARLATRMLGGGSAALAAEGGVQWLQERKSQREIFGAKQESTWNPNLRFSWNPLQMAAGLFRREASVEQTQKWAGQLEAIIKDDDDTRLNDAIIGQAGRTGREKMTRALVAGLVFTAVAAGMPGRGFRFVEEQTGAAEIIRAKAKAWTHDLLKGDIAEATTNQEMGAAAPQRETLYGKIRRGFGVGKPTGAAETSPEPTSPIETRESIGKQIDKLQEQLNKSFDESHNKPSNNKQYEDKQYEARVKMWDEMILLKDKLNRMEPIADKSARPKAESSQPPAPEGAKTAPPRAAATETKPPVQKPSVEALPNAELQKILQTDIDDQVAWENNIAKLGLKKEAVIEFFKNSMIDEMNTDLNPEHIRNIEHHAQTYWQTYTRDVIKDPRHSDILRSLQQRSAELATSSGASAPVLSEQGKGTTPKTQTPAEKQPPQGTRAEKSAPKNAREVAARAAEIVTVRKGEGAWQAVRRQFYERIKAEPEKYNLTAEEAQKLPELDKLGKDTKAAKILNRETLKTLKEAGYINPDGTTKLGMRPDARVILSPDNKVTLEYEGKGKPTYPFSEQKTGVGQPADETLRERAAGGRSYRDYTAGMRVPDETAQFIADSVPEGAMTSQEYAASPAGQAAAEAAAVKTESGNLRAAHLTKGEYRPIAQMTGETFIKELGRHATEINEYRAHGGRKPEIFINRGALTARGFRVELPQAEKYLDLSERLEKHLNKMSWTPRQRLLKQPLGELLRAIDLKK